MCQLHQELFGTSDIENGKIAFLHESSKKMMAKYTQMKRVILEQNIREHGQDELAILLNVSQEDLDLFIEILNLPNLLNNLINLEQYASATK